ncbi:unnamed protein product [Blepharisma stoltei]|uniref:Uncharacterized protein n=1 Tax=Blepharisma stoltei TaxID=1481888 RepID=A0AAU9JTE4_9CILI|nr:unnamed protein product [Blepharisma stoltei]
MKLSQLSSIANKIASLPSSKSRKIVEIAPSIDDLQAAVELPIGEDLNEWYAVHIHDFHNEIYLLYDSISELCTSRTCPTMSAGEKYEYFWVDAEETKQPTRVTAYEYITNVMSWIENLLENEMLFPTAEKKNFPAMFVLIVKTVLNRLFRVYAHIYYSHLDDVNELGLEFHLNTSFRHFVYFVNRFNLMKERDMEPLREEISCFMKMKGRNLYSKSIACTMR